jgi:hypothetical protein
MSRKLEPSEGVSLGDISMEARYAAVLERARRMDGSFDVTSSVDFAIAAWHLIADWLPAATDKKYRLAKSKLQLDRLPTEMKLLRSTLRDIATGEKHCILTPSERPKRVVTHIEPGVTGSWYAYFFHERIPGVTTLEGYYFSVRKLRDLIVEYLDWVFDDRSPAGAFPGTLLGKIWICNPANGAAGAVPPPGAVVPPVGDPGFVI